MVHSDTSLVTRSCFWTHNRKTHSGSVQPELRPSVHPAQEAHHVLAEAVAEEEHSILSDVCDQSRSGALVEALQTPASARGHEAVSEAPVCGGEGLHLDFSGVERLAAQHTCCTAWEYKKI